MFIDKENIYFETPQKKKEISPMLKLKHFESEAKLNEFARATNAERYTIGSYGKPVSDDEIESQLRVTGVLNKRTGYIQEPVLNGEPEPNTYICTIYVERQRAKL
jgi:hypothetical protein